ncbi:chlorite dismutase family protein [Leptolyngbya sp. 7M]|uniref:chlorite dismutase family protein n=1 Tax=Leptolyngbya sp. 7M TaxID=2812896 RepID=UPI001B8AD49C|nr:chlorite dismutase family protein [Leptolyngbya sp. 7M]QYO65276.1 chlorite dismutase family protein [Leptolyngbya sp. 7M]
MENLGKKKAENEQVGLRLVEERTDPTDLSKIETQFVSFIFFRIDPQWRRLDPDTKSVLKSEFQAVYNSFRDELIALSYSLVGFDSKADLMIWRVGCSLDSFQEMTAKLYRTRLGSYLETADNYMAVTKGKMFITEGMEDRDHAKPGQFDYHFLYPCAKHKDWYEKPASERDALIEENFMVGKRFPNIRIHLTHAFGFSDQEYLISFETDEPGDFLALTEELRQTPASKFTLRGMPIYTCRQRTLMECLDALG